MEEAALDKHEFVNGRIYAMAGARSEHNEISANIITELLLCARRKKCKVLTSDQRVRAGNRENYFYPDVTVVCAKPQFGKKSSLLNPTIVVEVLSNSTKEYDFTTKLTNYETIESLQGVVHAAQDRPWIQVWARDAASGSLIVSDIGEGMNAQVTLPFLNCILRNADIYEDVDFTAQPIHSDDEDKLD